MSPAVPKITWELLHFGKLFDQVIPIQILDHFTVRQHSRPETDPEENRAL